MNSRNLWITLLVVGGAVMALSWFMKRSESQANPNAASAATAPAAIPAPASQSAPPTSSRAPASQQVPASSAAWASSRNPSSQSATSASSGPVEAVTTPAAPPLRPRAFFFPAQDARTGPQWKSLGSLVIDANYLFQVDVTTEGAAVSTLKLTHYFATVADKKLAAACGHDRAKFDGEVAANPDKYGGNYSLLNPVVSESRTYLPLATHRIDIWLDANDPNCEPIGWNLDNKQWQLLPDLPITGKPGGAQSVQFGFQIKLDPNFADATDPGIRAPLLKVVKTYTVRPVDYSVDVSLDLINESNLPIKVRIDQYGPTGIPTDDATTDTRQVDVGKIKDSTPLVIFKPHGHLATMTLDKFDPVGYSQEGGQRTLWIGVASKYFGSFMYPHPAPPEANALGWPAGHLQFSAAAALENQQSRAYLTDVTIGMTTGKPADSPVEIAPRGTLHVALDVFAGPKKRDLFDDDSAAGFRPIYQELHYRDTIEFGSCCSWGPLTLGMMWLLQFLSKVALGNYGVAIILLVIIVRVAMHPLTKKGQVMMSKMQKMGPAMEALKKKYADDKEQLQKEMMKLYGGGLPQMLGCLPMMLQMPIWAALFGALNASVELRQAPFLPVWLTDLSAQDAIWRFPLSWAFVGGHNLNLLPILGCVSMFIQMKYTPQGAPPTTKEQKQQQAMMKWMMPVMMMFMFYSWPTGLNLYYMASGFVAAGEQYVIRKHIREKEALAAATTTFVDAGKASRSNRPKKPKGPAWFKKG